MKKKLTTKEFANKVEWEGGLYDAVAGYGLNEADLDYDANPSLWQLVFDYSLAVSELQGLEHQIEEILDASASVDE